MVEYTFQKERIEYMYEGSSKNSLDLEYKMINNYLTI